jgi:hypothetical protein
MDHTVLFDQTLTGLGFDLVPVYNCFDVGYRADQGWPLKLPDVDFTANTLLLLHFQDFVTPTATGCVELEQVERHYGSRANQVLVTYWSHGLDRVYRGPVNLIEFSSHNMQTIQGAVATQHQWQPAFEQPRTQAWQCLNGRMCLHRRRAVDQLLQFENGCLSYGNEIALPEWSYQTYRGTENHDNFVRLAPLYARSAVNIVTETQYDSRPGIVTEKTLQAMIAKQIPIVIGHPGIVQDCKELGFDMFDDVVDCGYDWAPNHSRVELAIDLNRKLIRGDIDLAPYQARLNAQQKFVLEQYVGQLSQQFIVAATKLRASQKIYPFF